MRYRIQKGLVLEQVCGVHILIATLDARKHCPYLTQLNDASAFIWSLLMSNMDTKDMPGIITDEYDVTPDKAAALLSDLINELETQHFISRADS